MRIRTTAALDQDVLERVKAESRARGASFSETLNELLRLALLTQTSQPIRSGFRVEPSHMGYRPGMDYDNIESLLESGEGQFHR
jgi:hypothetical protein